MTTRFGNIAVSFLGLAVLGCSDQTHTGGQSPTTEAAAKSLSVLAWENSFTVDAIEGFEARSGAAVVLDSFDTADELIERLKANPGEYDVILIDDANLHSLKEARLVRALDHRKLKNFANIGARFRDLDFDPENRHSVPYNWGTTLIAYRSDKVVDPEPSWAILFDDRYAGKVSMLPEKTDWITSILFHLGIDPATASLADLRVAEEMQQQQLSDKRVRISDYEAAQHALETGDQWIAMMYSSDAAAIAKDPKANISAFIPRDGALLWLDSFVIARDSPNPELAHAFLDYMLEPEVAASVSNGRCFATANAKARPFLNQDLIDDVTVYPAPEILDRCRFLSSKTGEVLELMNTSWWEMQGREEVKQAESLTSKEF